MIFIKTHKDFNFDIIPIYKENYNDFSIICREKLQDNYPINVIYDNDNFFNKWSNLYGELTYHYYVYKHINEYGNIIGLLQYKRFTNEYVLNNYKEILNKYDIILPNKMSFKKIYGPNSNIINQYNLCHIYGLLEDIMNLIYEYIPSYKSIDLCNIDYIIPHNIFIMKKQDYIDYCRFIFWCYKIFNLIYHIYDKVNDKEYLRILSFLNERISTIFFIKHFINNDKKIFYYEQDWNFQIE